MKISIPRIMMIAWTFLPVMGFAQPPSANRLGTDEFVKKTKIKPGKVDLKPQKAIYIEIPSQNGYLEFKVEGLAEREAILTEVTKQYQSAFQKQTNITHVPDCEWGLIPNAHPSTATYRYCLFADKIGYWQTCECAICCSHDKPPFHTKREH